MSEEITNDLVRYSRAGDVFHYRWVALRCLNMIHPLSNVNMITVESSKESKSPGEYIIDAAEYVTKEEKEEIHYYQLKHSTVRAAKNFTLSELKDSICGFAERYIDHRSKGDYEKANFYVITNRVISSAFKNNILKIKYGKSCTQKFTDLLKEYTKLDGEILSDFCGRLYLLDGYEDYQSLGNELYFKMGNLLSGDLDDSNMDTLVSMISNKVLPDSDGRICVEDVLKRLGCSSIRDMYPAIAEFDVPSNIFIRRQYIELIEQIKNTDMNVIVHAPGGVGKSVFAQAIELDRNNDVVILYDCFGAGKYRNRSKIRHTYNIALTQIINELATRGLCDPMLTLKHARESEISNTFLNRIETAISNLRSKYNDRELYIVIDAADNAEMAAKEFNDSCFVHELIREKMPKYCHLIMTCRTERIDLLQPTSLTKKFELYPFSVDESQVYLQKRVEQISDDECIEIHRLTSGNPRVQSNTISFVKGNKNLILEYLGPRGTTVDGQIEHQLDCAINKIKDSLTNNYKEQIDAICCGLATLPPFIPISVLAKVANVEETVIKSFISELGRTLLLLDEVVQFRDEPTESWFRNKYLGNKEQIGVFIERLKELACGSVYVSEVLPVLYLQAERYKELVELALSEEHLPNENPIDSRSVSMFRLEFAFKAALKSRKYADATKLALLAGEESAGNNRQSELFKNNTDLISVLQNKEKVQELAFKKVLIGKWLGSENIYKASLLASIEEYKGEALSYFKSANQWMSIYLKEYSEKDDKNSEFYLKEEEIAELAYTCYTLYGLNYVVDFMIGWKPLSLVFNLFTRFTKRLIDFGKFSEVNEISKIVSSNMYAIMGINYELEKVGLFIDKDVLNISILCLETNDIESMYCKSTCKDQKIKVILAYIEACIYHNINCDNLHLLINNYLPKKPGYSFDSDFFDDDRDEFLRSRAIISSLNTNLDEDWLPKDDDRIDKKKYEQVYDILFIWYEFRLKCIIDSEKIKLDELKQIEVRTDKKLGARYETHDALPYDISRLRANILKFGQRIEDREIKEIYEKVVNNIQYFKLESQIEFLRAAKRLEHLEEIHDELEVLISEEIEVARLECEIKLDKYVDLARAVLSKCIDDSVEYFNRAIEVATNFGDELPYRWKAIATIAEKCSEKFNQENELAYRFIRCAELVGENVSREKYWDRDQAIRICTQLSGAEGLGVISRWRERDIGYFPRLLPIVAESIVHNGYLEPKIAWSLSAFMTDTGILEYSKLCSEAEKDSNISCEIIEKGKKYFELMKVGSLKVDQYSNYKSNTDEESTIPKEVFDILKDIKSICENDVRMLFNEIDKSNNYYKYKANLWDNLYRQVSSNNSYEFIMMIINLLNNNLYKTTDVLKYIPNTWLRKPSLKKRWNGILRDTSTKYSKELLNSYTRDTFINDVIKDELDVGAILEGILIGISQCEYLSDIDYFEYASVSAQFLNHMETRDITDFALKRLEIHIQNNFGDGERCQNCYEDIEAPIQISRFIWTALGSPEASMRWQAVHAIKRLCEFNCTEIISELLKIENHKDIKLFIHKDYYHYTLHSILYLLIALQRVAIDNPTILLPSKDKFMYYATRFMPHALIQKYSVDIIKSIEKSFPGTYSKEAYSEAIESTKSEFPIINKENITIGEEENIEDDGFYNGYDFVRYWFGPLGKVFGVSEQYIKNRANKVVKDLFNIKSDGYNDSRHEIWEQSRYYAKTDHSHGTYPVIEKYDFYISYHAMLVVASELLKEKSLIKYYEWTEKPWEEWIKNHLISCDKGYLLSDYRSIIPKDISLWYENKKNNEWIDNIQDEDFINAIKCVENDICLSGYWELKHNNYKEEIIISSALVSKEGSSSLVAALTSYENPHDYKLPDYKDVRWEYSDNVLKLKGIIEDMDIEMGIDKLDPWAGGISKWNAKIGDEYLSLLEKEDIRCYMWSIPYTGHRDQEDLIGRRLNISRNCLQELINKTELYVVIEVQIRRTLDTEYKYNRDYSYKPPLHRILIFNEKGELQSE